MSNLVDVINLLYICLLRGGISSTWMYHPDLQITFVLTYQFILKLSEFLMQEPIYPACTHQCLVAVLLFLLCHHKSTDMTRLWSGGEPINTTTLCLRSGSDKVECLLQDSRNQNPILLWSHWKERHDDEAVHQHHPPPVSANRLWASKSPREEIWFEHRGGECADWSSLPFE